MSLAWEALGMLPAGSSEIDPSACAVLAHRHPPVCTLGDMTRIADQVRAGTVAAPDILVGVTPRQSFSITGARQGLAERRLRALS